MSRLSHVDWARAGDGEPSPSDQELFFNFLSLARGACRAHGITAHPLQSFGNHFSFPRLILGERLDPIPRELSDFANSVVVGPYRWRGYQYVASAIVNYVQWFGLDGALRDEVVVLPSGYETPFDDLIEFLRRGGAFTCEHGMLAGVLP